MTVRGNRNNLVILPIERIERSILLIRGRKVMLDSDLASLYGVETFRFNEAIKRNKDRFPADFMFQLSKEEHDVLTSQFAISKSGSGGRRTLPYVFSEHGALAAAFVLNSPKAISVSTQVVRAFVRLREVLSSNADLARKLDIMEKRYDERFLIVFKELRKLMSSSPLPSKTRIGF